MKTKVWLSSLIISSLLCSACANTAAAVESESQIPLEQDTLGMVPDFSYAVIPQLPYIYVDQIGYRSEDKKTAFFQGTDLETAFSVLDEASGETVYEGKLYEVKELEGKTLYAGDFTWLSEEGDYVITHPKIGDSYTFTVEDSVYDKEFLVLQKSAKEYTYTSVSELTYVLANLMFIQEICDVAKVDVSFIEEKMILLLNSQDAETGAFYSEIFEEPIVVPNEAAQTAGQIVGLNSIGTVSLSTTAQMSGALAQYSILCKDNDPELAARCLTASQKAYRYMEQHKANTDTDAWYYAAVQLYRATGQYKYRSAIAEYDAVDSTLYSSTEQGYTILADFIYLLTPGGTDYARCATLLKRYMDKAQSISVNSSRDNFYVLENIDTMEEKEVLDDMIILGVVNHVLSGQEYAGIQRNYVHYLAGVNIDAQNLLTNQISGVKSPEGINITNISKLLVIFGNLCQE